jgi:glycosyltransferase involved in cell wall biosynthesis
MNEWKSSSLRTIMVIAFKFPPLGGMRVKRMTMFTKYLAQRGYKVHVITVNWRVDMPDTWLNSIEHPSIIIHRIPSWAPHNLFLFRPKTFFGRLLGKAAKLLRKLIYFVDEAQYWGLSLLPYAARLIKQENINNVICTGAPFMANYWAAHLKTRVPQINLIQDFRDPWNDHLCAPYSDYFLFDWQKKVSQACERYALSKADVVTTVTATLRKRFEGKTNSPTQFVTITNGYDPERYRDIVYQPDPNKMRMVYIGNLGVGRDHVIEDFLPVLQEIVDDNAEFAGSFELATYGHFPPSVRPLAEPLVEREILQINDYVAPKQALRVAGNAFALLLINAQIFPYLVSGKVYEYIALQRPIYALTPEGELTQLMHSGKLGFIALLGDPEAQKRELLELFDLWKRNPTYVPPANEAFRQQFQYDQLVGKLETYLI